MIRTSLATTRPSLEGAHTAIELSQNTLTQTSALERGTNDATARQRWYQRTTPLDRFVANTPHPWGVIVASGAMAGNALKAGAWLLPFVLLEKKIPYAGVVGVCGSVAGAEYMLTKTALVTGHLHAVNEHAMATLMFASDGLWRTGIQCAVDKSGVTVWDWGAVGAMIGVAGMHALASSKFGQTPRTEGVPQTYTKQAVVNASLAVALAGAAIGLAFGGVLRSPHGPLLTGPVCLLATVATVGKTAAWWAHIQPFIQRLQLNMPMQVLLGWQTAVWSEYWALIGAITMGIGSLWPGLRLR